MLLRIRQNSESSKAGRHSTISFISASPLHIRELNIIPKLFHHSNKRLIHDMFPALDDPVDIRN